VRASSWTNTGNLDVGGGSLRVEAGGQVSNTNGRLGTSLSSTGMATVTGESSSWTSSGNLSVGGTGDGSLRIEAGGQVNNTNGSVGYNPHTTGTATVTGEGSKWINGGTLHVGKFGDGTLVVEEGGQVSNTSGYLGHYAGATGSATITGVGSKWTSSNVLFVAGRGSATLNVSDGGEVVAGILYASVSDLLGDGTVTATRGALLDADLFFDAAQGNQATTSFGSGGTLTVHADGSILGVGFKQSGSLTVKNGASITSGLGYLGNYTGSTGAAIVTGEGSQWNNSEFLYVGSSGNGILSIEAGGQVSNGRGSLGMNSGATGVARVTGAGSKWTNSSYLDVGRHGGGTLTIDAGGQVSNAMGHVGHVSGSMGTVIVTGTGSTWTNNSHLFVGQSGSGKLTVTNGGLVTVAETLYIDSHSDSGSSINMASGGMLALWGEADQTLAAFLDLVSGSGEIRFWNASLDDWAPLTTATYGEDYTLDYLTTGDLAGYTLLTVGMLGDFDGDGMVDGHDFLAWQRNSHLGDLAGWETAFGNTTSQVSSATIVPEPSALWLVAAGGMLLFPSRQGAGLAPAHLQSQ